MSPKQLNELTEHKRQRTTRQQDLDRERARELKTAAVSAWRNGGAPKPAAVSAFDVFLEDWKRNTIAAMYSAARGPHLEAK